MTDKEVIAHATAAAKRARQGLPPLDRLSLTIAEAGALPTGGAGEFLKQAAIPAALGIAGAVGGTLAAGPAGGVAGGAAGGMAGETINQLTGITPTSVVLNEGPGNLDPNKIAATGEMALLAPAAFKLLQKGGGAALRMVPGAGQAFQELGADVAQTLPGLVKRGPVSSDVLYDLVEKQNPRMDASALLTVVNRLSEQQLRKGSELANPTITKVLNGLRDTIIQNGKQVPFRELRAKASEYGLRGHDATRVEKGVYDQLFKAIRGEGGIFEQAVEQGTAGMAAVESLRAANRQYAKEKATQELTEIITPSALPGSAVSFRPSDQMITFNRKAIKAGIERNTYLSQSLDDAEKKAIASTLDGLGIIPGLPTAPGANFGSGRNVLGAGAGFVGGMAQTGDPVLSSTLAAAVPMTLELVAAAAMTETGRALIKRLAQAGGGKLTPQALSILGAAIESGIGGP